jgi:hypothetical protein
MIDNAPWVVWSFEHDAWWAPGRLGYVQDLAAAGRYTKLEAIEIERHANQYLRDGVIREQALPLAQAERDGAPEP